jgi:O-methyltransferase involved in polyketide biosynthesis
MAPFCRVPSCGDRRKRVLDRQVVLLGAGLDTRAFRLELPSDLPWFEVDRPFPAKKALLAAETARCDRRVQSFVDAGLDPSADTLWVAEGLFFYLTAATRATGRTKLASG